MNELLLSIYTYTKYKNISKYKYINIYSIFGGFSAFMIVTGWKGGERGDNIQQMTAGCIPAPQNINMYK